MSAYTEYTLLGTILALFLVGCESGPQPTRESTTSRIIANPADDTVNQLNRDMSETVLVVKLDVARGVGVERA